MSRRLIGDTEVLAEVQDPEFGAEWERTALARPVAEAVIRYRVERGLARMRWAGASRWWRGWRRLSTTPSMDTLLTRGRVLGLRAQVDVGPKTGVVAKVTKSRAAWQAPPAPINAACHHAGRLPQAIMRCGGRPYIMCVRESVLAFEH